jgi:hypothetical protein
MTSLPSFLREPVTRRWLPLILGLAFGIRAALGWMHPFLLPDSADYDALGHAIAQGHSYACGNFALSPSGDVTPYVASRMPGYPLLLAAVYLLGGGVKMVIVLQAFMGAMIVLLTYALGTRLSQATGLLAALLAALDPLSIGFAAALLTETPFTLCLMGALWLCVRIAGGVAASANGTPSADGNAAASSSRTWRLWIVLGFLWAIAVYLRASALWAIVPLALASSLLASSRARRAGIAAWMPSLIPLAMVFVLLTPWLIRNYVIFQSGPLRLTTLEGISLYEAVYPGATGGPKQDQINLNIPPEMKSLNEAQRNDEWSRRAWTYIRSDPLRIAKLARIKIGRTWSPWFNAAEFNARPIQWMMTLWNAPLLVFALVGLFSRMRRELLILLLIPLGYFTAVHALFLGSVRYRTPLMPLVCLLAAQGILHAVKWLPRRQRLSIRAV